MKRGRQHTGRYTRNGALKVVLFKAKTKTENKKQLSADNIRAKAFNYLVGTVLVLLLIMFLFGR